MLALPAIDHPASLSRRSFSTAFDQILAQNARPIICFSAWDFMLDFVSLSSHPTLPQSPQPSDFILRHPTSHPPLPPHLQSSAHSAQGGEALGGHKFHHHDVRNHLGQQVALV